MGTKKKRPSLSAMDEFDLETKIQRATETGIKKAYTTQTSSDFLQHTENERFKGTPKRKPPGRPKKNPYLEEKKLTIRMPERLHRQLRFASADTGKPMVEIAVDALIKYLIEYEKQ